MEKTLTSRQRQAIETKKRIYEATKSLVDKYGIDGISIRAIAKTAGISVGSFYRYYSSKDEVLFNMALYVKKKFLNKIKNQLTQKKTYSEKIFDLMVHDINFISNYTRPFKHSLREILRGKKRTEYLFSDANITYKVLRELVKSAQKTGEFPVDIDAEDICIMMQTMACGLVDLDIMDENFDMVGYAKRVYGGMLKALTLNASSDAGFPASKLT